MPKVYPLQIKQKAVELRKEGFTYSEILRILKYPIPKNTFSSWFKNITLTDEAQDRILKKIKDSGTIARPMAWQKIRQKRIDLIEEIKNKVEHDIYEIDEITSRIILSMLYLGEGGKVGEWVRFGNSDPKTIQLFLNLLRRSFLLDETRLRGKVQCRADQDVKYLEEYWSNLTRIPINQFHKTSVDKRTIGKPTKKLDYKGVFVVIYCSNRIFLELKFISDIIYDRIVKNNEGS